MKDENDPGTRDIFSEKENRLKIPKGDYVRLHMNKVTGSRTKTTTVSIEHYSYVFLSHSLGEKPFTREANKTIKTWINSKIETDPTYDKDAPYAFSSWLKRNILLEIVSEETKAKYWEDKYLHNR